MSEIFEKEWLRLNEGGRVVRRDLMSSGIPYMDLDWIAGIYAPPEVERTEPMRKALALSEELIDEVRSADRILIGTPMYNYSVPAVLKSWIDYIVRPGFTFALAPGWPGLLSDVRSLIVGGSLGVNRGAVALSDHLAKFAGAVTHAANS